MGQHNSHIFEYLLLTSELCSESDQSENCRGAYGTIQIVYVGEEDNEEVTYKVTAMLNDNSNEISGLLEEIVSIEFVRVSDRKSDVLPRPLLQSSWMLAPFAAGLAILVYAVFIAVRDRKKKNPNQTVLFMHSEQDDMKQGLFDPNDKLRSDSVNFPIKTRNWNEVQLPFQNEGNDHYVSDSEDYNRESLERRAFPIPLAANYNEDDEQLPLEMSIVPQFDANALPGTNGEQRNAVINHTAY